MNQIAELLAAANIVLDLDVDVEGAPVRAVGALFERNAGSTQRRSRRASPRARSSARPASARASRSRTAGSRDCSEARGAFVRLQHADRRSTRPTASRSRRSSCCSCPSRRPTSICSSCPSSRRCFPSARFATSSPTRRDARRAARAVPSLGTAASTARSSPTMSARSPCGRSASSSCSTTTASGSGSHWLAGRQGGNRVLTGEAALKPTIGQVGHMNFIHPFRIQILGAAEAAYLRALAGRRARARRSTGCSPPSSPRSSSPTARTCRAHLARPAATRTTSRSSPRRSRRRTSSTCSASTSRACSPSRRRCTACSSTCSRWAC